GFMAAEVEDEERFRVRCGRFVSAAGRELDMGVRAWEGEEDPVVPLVALESPDLRKAETIAIEADDFSETIRMSCDADLHISERLSFSSVEGNLPVSRDDRSQPPRASSTELTTLG